MDKEFFQNISFLKPFKFERECHGNIFIKSVNNIPIHMNDGVELLYVVEGNVRVKISFNNYDLKKGDFLIVNTFEVHSIKGISPDNIVLFFEIDNKYIFNDEEYLFAFDPDFYRTCKSEQVYNAVKTMVDAYINCSEFHIDDKINEYVKSIGEICIDHFQIQNFDPINKEASPLIESEVKLERIGNAFKYFYQEHQDKILLKQVADREFIDKFYASHLIKTGTGSSFQEMLSIVRVDRAEVLLLGTNKKLDAIAADVGFSSYRYFIQIFKQFYHMSPSEYKKTVQSNIYPIKKDEYYPEVIKEEKLKNELADKFDLKCPQKNESFVEIEEDKDKVIDILDEAGFFKDLVYLPKEKIEKIIFKLK